MSNWIVGDITITVKPVTKGSKARVELSLTVTASQTVEVAGDSLSGKGIVYKAV